MRVAYIAHLSEQSGSGIALVNIAAGLITHGISGPLILPGPGPLSDIAAEKGLETVTIENPQLSFDQAGNRLQWIASRRKYILNLTRYLRQGAFDLVYINSSASVFPAVAARKAGIPIAWHIHETLANNSIKVRLKARLIRHYASGLIFASNSGMESLRPPKGTPAMVALNAISPGLLAAGRARLAEPPSQSAEPLIFSNGTIPLKGTHVLLQAVATARATSAQQSPPPALAIAGPPPAADYAEQLRYLAEQPSLRDAVQFTGLLPNLNSWYSRATLYASASLAEAMPIAVIEAMASGVPVIATDVGDCRLLLEDGKAGWVVPANNADTLAAAILDALNHPDLARQKALLAHEKISGLYGKDPHAFYEPLAHFLQNLMD